MTTSSFWMAGKLSELAKLSLKGFSISASGSSPFLMFSMSSAFISIFSKPSVGLFGEDFFPSSGG